MSRLRSLLKISNNLIQLVNKPQMVSFKTPIITKYQQIGVYRNFSSSLTVQDITDRVMENVLLYDKLDKNKVNQNSHFVKDLGLDSLDHVEIMMSIENEFGQFIPDADAEKLMTPKLIIDYLCDKSGIAVC